MTLKCCKEKVALIFVANIPFLLTRLRRRFAIPNFPFQHRLYFQSKYKSFIVPYLSEKWSFTFSSNESFQTEVLILLSDWLVSYVPRFDWLRAPPIKHQLEKLNEIFLAKRGYFFWLLLGISLQFLEILSPLFIFFSLFAN